MVRIQNEENPLIVIHDDDCRATFALFGRLVADAAGLLDLDIRWNYR
jgi:hypothetical protein